MDTMLSRRSFLLTWCPQPSAWTKFKHGGHGGHGSGLSLISYVSNGYWWLLRIWECWGTPYSLACTSDEDFLDKNGINSRCLLRSLRFISCRLPFPFEGQLSTVTTYVSWWWRLPSPPRKRHRAINQDKPIGWVILIRHKQRKAVEQRHGSRHSTASFNLKRPYDRSAFNPIRSLARSAFNPHRPRDRSHCCPWQSLAE